MHHSSIHREAPSLLLEAAANVLSPNRIPIRRLTISSSRRLPPVDKRASCCQLEFLLPRKYLNAIPQRTLVISRLNCKPIGQGAMLSQYLGAFMSTVQRGFTSTGTKQLENEHIASLLADSRANKQVKVRACGQLYAELSKTKPILYSGAPHEGIEFEVQYYDSLELLPSSSVWDKQSTGPGVPTVCLLHGAPGHYQDFANIIYHLTNEGIRVIAPNFPTYAATFEHSFRHSPRERLEYLLEFFKAIQVSRLDLLAGHSSAVYTIFELLNHSKQQQQQEVSNMDVIDIKSLGLFSTPSHQLPHNLAVTPFRLFTLKLFDYPLLRPFILALIIAFVKMQGIRNRVDRDKIENLLIAGSAMGYSQHAKMAGRLKLLTKFNIPTFLAYGTNDRLITVNNFKQLEQDLGITNEEQVRRYKADGKLESAASERHELVDVSRFESGGHYTFQKYSSQVSDDLYNFLIKRVLCNNKNKVEVNNSTPSTAMEPPTAHETTKL